MRDMAILLILLIVAVFFSVVMLRRKKNSVNSFLYGFSLGILGYLFSSFFFFWFAVFRRMAVLHIPFVFDSEVAFAVIIIPVMVALPWLPAGIITGIISRNKGNKAAVSAFYIILALLSIGLSILYWNLPYN
ncbi:MAG: hypothetical protein LIR50_08155 [Bacillota bacterium]|nr:hypothetical protein [Bacillota bacterium]